MWERLLIEAIRQVTGPEDEFDDETNGDPDSLVGEEDEMGFNEMVRWPEPLFAEDDGFDDADLGEDDEDEEGDEEDDEDDE